MKVNNSGNANLANQVRSKDVEKDLNVKSKENRASTADLGQSSKLDLSVNSPAFQKAKAIASADTVDEAKVARLQKLIDEGKYKVDSAAIADRLVDEHLEAGE